MGMRSLLPLLYATMSIWTPFLIYFWVSVLSLCIAPFVFNPHQFSAADFIIDYRYVHGLRMVVDVMLTRYSASSCVG